MKLKGKGRYLGSVLKKSNQSGKAYQLVKVIDDEKNTFEMYDDKLQKIDKPDFTEVEFEVDVRQGKFPKFDFLSIK